MTQVHGQSGRRRERHVLDPVLPHALKGRTSAAIGDVQLQQFVGTTTRSRDRGRVRAFEASFGDRYDELRDLGGRIKRHTVDHLDVYLERFVEAATLAGTRVHFAVDAAQANAICAQVARDAKCSLCVKSKSMVTEETHLVPALEAVGVRTVETDLGEFIIQLDDDAPSHLVTPMIHKNRASVGRTFVRELGAAYTDDPTALTMIAREHMRSLYRRADLGISGGNFLVAETGSLVVCTNEGNADLSIGSPRVHVAMVGIEKLVPTLNHLSVLLKLLARSATNQPITVYTSLITGPRRSGDTKQGLPSEVDGPDEMHIILIDNGRTAVLREETRELLQCIRCGACLNACPVYRKVGGGHAYGAVYSGPIGAVLTPLLKGLENYPDLPGASSLCGACYEACPVHIDIPHHLIRLREQIVRREIEGPMERMAYRLCGAVLADRMAFSIAGRLHRFVLRVLGRKGETGDVLNDRRWIGSLPGPMAGWTDSRDLPTPTSRSFREWWRKEHSRGGGR
jgi:L-lactate dehydrogenase complex protein LldF